MMAPSFPAFRSLMAAAVLTAALLLSGCTGSGSTGTSAPAAFPSHTAPQIRQQIVLSADTITSFSAKARLAMDTPQRNGQFNATIRQRRSDSLYMSVSPGMGIEAARILVTPDSFFVYDRINKQLAYGGLENAQARLPFLVTTNDIFDNLLGVVAPDPSVSWQVEADDEYYYLHDPAYQRTFKIDPTRWRVVQYEQRTADGTIVETRTFDDFTTVEGVTLPRQVTLRRPQDNSVASLYYRNLDLNPGSLSFDLDVGHDVSRITPLQSSGR